MKYLYKNLPFSDNKITKDISLLKKGDSLEVRLSELNYGLGFFWEQISKVKCEKIEFSLIKVDAPYGFVQVFKFV